VLGPVFMFCATELILSGTDGVRSRACFHVLRSRACFRRCGGRLVPFSCFSLPNTFFSGADSVGSRFHFLRSRPRFWRFRGRRVLFSCFASPSSFSTVPRASGPAFVFCVPILIFGGSLGVRSSFHVLRSQTRFQR
jgi:hypothetical protein